MQRIKNVSFGGFLVGILSIFAAVICIFFAGTIFFIPKAMPHEAEEYYLDVKGLTVSDGLVVLSPSDFQKRLVSSQKLETVFSGRMKAAFGWMFCVIIVLTVILGAVLWKIYSIKICLPVKHLSAKLENMICTGTVADGEDSVETDKNMTALPQELICIKNAADVLLDNVSTAYSDFSHLSRYVSHEYKNTMALLRAKAQNGNMAGITQTVDKLVKDMDDILTLCANKGENFDTMVDLALVCGMAVDEYNKSKINIEFCFDEDCDTGVRGNEMWIYRAVCNLIDNAVKYSDNGKVYVTVGVKKGCPFLEVSDRGIGIDREKEDRIFEEGYRIGELKKDGYGIGLSLVKHVAWLCNAYLWVKSEKEVGSSFKMVFPNPI